jgi:hypothetical protein
MKINLNNLTYYYLTLPKGSEENLRESKKHADQHKNRKDHILNEFNEFDLKEVNPIPSEYFDCDKELGPWKKTRKSGASGFLKIIDLASQYMTENFKPFVILEDDAKKTRQFPDFIDIPKDCDLLYIGLCQWGMTDKEFGVNDSVCYSEVADNENVIRIFNMLSLHGIMICSIRGMLSLQKCILEDFFKNQGWDLSIACMQPYINTYALREPLVHQYNKLGGEQKWTKINYKKLNEKDLPETWKNKKNVSIITNENENE